MPEQILPFYVVCDRSHSMTDHIEVLNDGLAELHHAVGTDPVAAARTRFCLIGFAGTAEVLQPLCRLSDLVELVGLSTQPATSFGAAFTLLRDTIASDVALLKAADHQVYRPVVFFLSDGHPTDPVTWPAAYQRLVDPDWPARPNVVAFGIGDADATTIARIGTFQAFVSRGGVTPAAALHAFTRTLAASVVRSGIDTVEDGVVLRVPERVPGFTALRVDRV